MRRLAEGVDGGVQRLPAVLAGFDERRQALQEGGQVAQLHQPGRPGLLPPLRLHQQRHADHRAIDGLHGPEVLRRARDRGDGEGPRRVGTLCPESGDAPRTLVGDSTRLRQVLINLLSNGIKYNRPGGSLKVEVDAQVGAVQIRLQDTGMGLSQEQQARLFMPFERLDADERQIEGTGIGLALSKRLVGLMGGQIGVDSEAGHGSTFWVTLPRSEDGARDAREAHPSQHGTAGSVVPMQPHPLALQGSDNRPACTILCVEDNALNLQLIEHLLGRLPGLQLLCATAAAQGLSMARDLRPDIVMLDINLPDMDGYEVIARLRADPATAAIPVLAVTANAMPGDAARARTAGFVGYITKPLNVATLMAEIERRRPRYHGEPPGARPPPSDAQAGPRNNPSGPH